MLDHVTSDASFLWWIQAQECESIFVAPVLYSRHKFGVSLLNRLKYFDFLLAWRLWNCCSIYYMVLRMRINCSQDANGPEPERSLWCPRIAVAFFVWDLMRVQATRKDDSYGFLIFHVFQWLSGAGITHEKFGCWILLDLLNYSLHFWKSKWRQTHFLNK